MTLACGISCQFCGRWEQPSEPTPATQSLQLLWESSGTWTYQSWFVWQKIMPLLTVSAAVICWNAGQRWLKSSERSAFPHRFCFFRSMKTSRSSWAWSRTSFQESNSIKPATRSWRLPSTVRWASQLGNKRLAIKIARKHKGILTFLDFLLSFWTTFWKDEIVKGQVCSKMHSKCCVQFTDSDGLAVFCTGTDHFLIQIVQIKKGDIWKEKWKWNETHTAGFFVISVTFGGFQCPEHRGACHGVAVDDVSVCYGWIHCNLVALDTCFLPGRGRRPDQSPALEAEGHPAVWDSEGPTRHDGPRAQRRRENDLHSHADESNDW